MKYKLHQWVKDFKLKSTFLLVSSSALGQLISYLLLPLLGRLYSPYEFNDFAIIYACIIPLSILATLKIELAIPQQHEESEKYHATRLCLISTIVQSLIILVSILVLDTFYEFSRLWYYLPLGITAFAFPQVLQVLVTSLQEYKRSSGYRIINNLALQFFSASFGFLHFGGEGLIIGFLLGQLIGTLILIQGHFKRIFPSRPLSFPWRDYKEYLTYIKFSTPQGIIETLQLSGTIALLDLFFGDPVPGAYYLAWRILQAPITMISNTVFAIQYNECSALKKTETSYHKKITKLFIGLLIIGSVFGFSLILFGKVLLSWFLGEQHFMSGEIVQWLAPMFILQFSISPFSFVAMLEGKQKHSFFLNVLDLLLKILGLYFGFVLGSIQTALILYSTFSCTILTLSAVWYFRLSK